MTTANWVGVVMLALGIIAALYAGLHHVVGPYRAVRCTGLIVAVVGYAVVTFWLLIP